MLSRQSTAASASQSFSRSMMTSTDEVIALIQETLQDASVPPWLPDLTPALAAAEWRKLGRDLGMTWGSYGTARVLSRDPEETCWLLAPLDAPSRYGIMHDSIHIELLPDEIARQWVSQGVRFFGAGEILREGVKDQVENSIRLIAGVPTMLATVCSLVRSLHLLDTNDNQVDVSFSEPDLPFSAFISVPGSGAQDGHFRVAEALLHEAMHLQLTLIEGFVPLVEPTNETFFSPWRNEYRTPLGVIHALYVFRVIDAFFGAILTDSQASESLRCHALNRRAEITQQIESIRGFSECPNLTDTGTALVSRMLG